VRTEAVAGNRAGDVAGDAATATADPTARVARAGRGAGSGVPVLGIDVGSTNVKVVLVGLDARGGAVTELATAAARTPRSPEALVRTVAELVREVLADRPAPRAVGIASMAETGALIAPDGGSLTELLRWDGRHGEDDAARVAADLGRAELFRTTGVRVSGKVPLVTWSRLRRTAPEMWHPTTRWAGAADVVCLALTGRLVTDHTLAGRTMGYRLPPVGQPLPESFDGELLGAVGLTPAQLPAVARPGEVAGTVLRGRFADAGLAVGTPVVVAGHDHAVGTWAAGVDGPGDRADSIGTAEAVVTVLGAPVDRAAVAAQGMSLVRTVGGVHEALLAGSPAAGAMVAWWLDTVLPGRSVESALAGLRPDGPTGLLVLPYPRGRQGPRPDPDARVRVVDDAGRDVTARALAPVAGRQVPAGAARLALAMLEGLAYHARWLLDTQALLAARGDPGRGTGGGVPVGADPARGTGRAAPVEADTARAAGPEMPVPATGDAPLRVLAGAAGTNAAWMAVKAALTPGPLHLVASAEPVAAGAALLAAERTGILPPGAVRLPSRVIAPAPAPDRYGATLQRFVDAATARRAPG